jgi:pimeloyl-ACP methyl ester carboxylesterase
MGEFVSARVARVRAEPLLLEAPRFEGALRLRDGRRLGFAEFGPPDGRPLLWCHGTPGARRQIPPEARALARERGVRIVSVERPGVGDSTPHRYGALVEFADDVAELCDALGVARFAVGGLSGGGPYALACARALPGRVVAALLLGSVPPVAGPDAVSGGIATLIRIGAPLLDRARVPAGALLRALVRLFAPMADTAIEMFARLLPAGDREVLSDEGIRAMFEEDLRSGSRHAMQAFCLDVALFGRPWGFALGEIAAPVHLWYGDADAFVSLAHGAHLARRIPHAKLWIRPGEGHLGGLAAPGEIFDAVFAHWPEEPRCTTS